MPKRQSPQSPTSSSSDESPNKKVKQVRATKPRKHPLGPFVYTDDVPVTIHDSPIRNNPFFTPDRTKEAEKMERKLVSHCQDYNTPNHGLATERRAMGECKEDTFDTYMSATMAPELYKRKEEYTPHQGRDGHEYITNIVYEFTYPNFPSFGDADWVKYYTTIDQSKTAESLASLGAEIPPYFIQAPHRCIVKTLYVVLDTCSEVFYIRLTNWVQKKVHSTSSCEFAWVDVF